MCAATPRRVCGCVGTTGGRADPARAPLSSEVDSADGACELSNCRCVVPPNDTLSDVPVLRGVPARELLAALSLAHSLSAAGRADVIRCACICTGSSMTDGGGGGGGGGGDGGGEGGKRMSKSSYRSCIPVKGSNRLSSPSAVLDWTESYGSLLRKETGAGTLAATRNRSTQSSISSGPNNRPRAEELNSDRLETGIARGLSTGSEGSRPVMGDRARGRCRTGEYANLSVRLKVGVGNGRHPG
jgi:hypothetical protein